MRENSQHNLIPSFNHPQIKEEKTSPQPLPQSAAKDDDGPSGSNTIGC